MPLKALFLVSVELTLCALCNFFMISFTSTDFCQTYFFSKNFFMNIIRMS